MHDPTRPLPSPVHSLVQRRTESPRMEAGELGRTNRPRSASRLAKDADCQPKINRAIDRIRGENE
jgi:hypothetical protein